MWKHRAYQPLLNPCWLGAGDGREHPTGAGRGGLLCPEALHKVVLALSFSLWLLMHWCFAVVIDTLELAWP